MAAEPKTYTVGFQVRNLGTFQDHKNKLLGDAALDAAVLARFKEILAKRLPGGTLSDDLKTFTTSEPVKLSAAGFYSTPLMIFPATANNKDNRKKLLDTIPVEQDPEDLGIGDILLFPVAKGGKGRKSRRSTRRRRTTRRR